MLIVLLLVIGVIIMYSVPLFKKNEFIEIKINFKIDVLKLRKKYI